jgi:hypothetical protein
VSLAVRRLEASDPDGADRRSAAGAAAGREVATSANALERAAVDELLKRLGRLKREIQGAIVNATGDSFRAFTGASLIAEIDHLVAQATAELTSGRARTVLNQAVDLGTASVDNPLAGARVAVGATPKLDRVLVTHAFDTQADLLTAAMQQFRNQVVAGVRRAAVAGASSFDELRKLAGSIDRAGFDGAAFKAERIVRTELGRVLQGASFDRMAQLTDSLPFLRKGWRATKDGRTRQGHVEAGSAYSRGHGIPVKDPFRINVYREFPGKPAGPLIGVAKLMFPVDPAATPAGRIAAGATIMCRCNLFTDFDLEDLSAFATGRSRAVTNPGVPGFAEPPIARPTPAAPPQRTAAETRAELTRVLASRELEKQVLQREIDAGYKQAATARAHFENIKNTPDTPEWAAARRALDDAIRTTTANAERLATLERQYGERARKVIELPEGARATVKYTIPDDAQFYRDYSWTPERETFGQAAEARARVADAIAIVQRLVSKELTFGNLIVDNVRTREGKPDIFGRANAVEAGGMSHGNIPGRRPNSINLTPWPDQRVIAHELGHILEFNNASVREAALAFLERRTRGEPLELMSKLVPESGYEPYERARGDKFRDPYIGKDYGAARWTEVVSMGLEYMFRDPLAFAREDPDMFDFIYDLLRGKPDARPRS